MEDPFSSYLLGKLSEMEKRLAPLMEPAAAPAPVVPSEPTPAQQNQHFLDHVEEIAGVKPQAATAAPEVPPKSISKASPRFARDFARWAEAIADGRCGVVD